MTKLDDKPKTMNEAFKKYKVKAVAPDLSHVIDCNGPINDKVSFFISRKSKKLPTAFI